MAISLNVNDVAAYKTSLVATFNSQYAKLFEILKGSLEVFAKRLFEAGLITKPVMLSNNYDNIVGEFLGGLEYMDSKADLQQHCQVLVDTLEGLGSVATRCAAKHLAKEWQLKPESEGRLAQPSLPEEVLMKHSVELCELLSEKDTQESLTSNLTAIGLLSQEKARSIGNAEILLQEVSIAIQSNLSLFADLLTEMKKNECLQEMVTKLEKSFMSFVEANLSNTTDDNQLLPSSSQLTFPSTDNEHLMTFIGELEATVADKVTKLQLSFHQWLLEVRKSIQKVDPDEVKFYTSLLLSGSQELTKLYLDKVNTPSLSVGSDTILFLMSQGLLSFWNYGTLQYIVKSLLQQDANVVTMMEEYDRDYHTFCDTLLQLQKAFIKDGVRNPRPKPPACLQQFRFKMKDPWPTKSVQQWRDKYSGMFPWSRHTVMTSITPGCIAITYVALPCVTSIVLRDLTDPVILEELESIGVTVVLPHVGQEESMVSFSYNNLRVHCLFRYEATLQKVM